MGNPCLATAWPPTVNVCMVADEAYVLHLRVALYSLLCNRDTSRRYDILILHQNLSEERKESLLHLADGQAGVSIRLIDMASYGSSFPKEASAYYSAAINYRLFLFDEMFANYSRMLYLDSDMIVLGDVSELFDTPLAEAEAAGVCAEDFRLLSKTKRAVYLDDMPYNVDNYRKDGLGMKVPEDYFNSGVLLLDLEKARRRISMTEVYRRLKQHAYTFSDQDVLNILFDGKVKMLDCRWNYQTCIEENLQSGNPHNEALYADLKRENPAVIHYIGHTKPWNAEKILGKHYWHYRNQLEGYHE